MKKHGNIIAFFLFFIWAGLNMGHLALAEEIYAVIPSLSTIKGSIHYSVVGRYSAEFSDFKGELYYDPDRKEVVGVDLSIDNKSLHSSFPSLDKIVLSPQLLDAEQYPKTLFKSKTIQKEKGSLYRVTGDLTLHGVTKEISFPFTAEGPFAEQQSSRIKASGEWVIARKEFDIYWSRVLDVGGILVGNHMVVSWEINASK